MHFSALAFKKNFLYFFLKNFRIFRERDIQNPGIFKTLVYSEHCLTSMTEYLVKIATYHTFLHFAKQNFFIFPEMELSSLIFQEVTFCARKMKKNPTLKMFLILQKMELFSSNLKKLFIFQERIYKT